MSLPRIALLACTIGLALAATGRGDGATTAAVTGSMIAGRATPTEGDETPKAKKSRLGDSGVYVDGRLVGIIRVLELPPSLEAHPSRAGKDSPLRYRVTELLAKLGVDVARVHAADFYGGRRTSRVEGDELRAFSRELTFDFSGGDRGKPRMHWPGGAFTAPSSIDMLSALALYVDRPAPRYHREDGGFVTGEDGAPIEGIPYAPPEQSQGTRVYVDGKLVALGKRKTLSDDLVLAGYATHATRYALDRYLASVGAPTQGARAVDFVDGDDLVARRDAGTYRADKASLAFTLPAHSQGRLAVEIAPAATVKISSVQLFVKTTPPKRWVMPREYVRTVEDTAREGAEVSAREQGGQDEAL